jgi:RNA polymerase primary sigma factor
MTLIANDAARPTTASGSASDGSTSNRSTGDRNPALLRAFSDVSSDPVRDYLRAIGRTRLLTADEEVELAQRIEVGVLAEERLSKKGDSLTTTERRELRTLTRDGQRAYETFIQSNLRLVVSIAKRYAGRGLPIMDVIQEGNLGLVRAVEKFDYKNGNKFSTYATWWIRQSILRGLADTARLIRIPVHTVEKIDKLDRIRRDLNGELGRIPTLEELSEVSNVSIAEITRLHNSDAETVSFAIPVGEDGSAELGDIIEDDDSPGPDEQVQAELRHEDLERLIDELPPRDARVVRLRFGLDGRSPMTLDQVGEIYGITRERVRQLENRSLERLRIPALRDYLD